MAPKAKASTAPALPESYPEPTTAVQQRAAKLILEAEKRAAARPASSSNSAAKGDGSDYDDMEDDDMELREGDLSAMGAGSKKRKQGLKGKLAGKKGAQGEKGESSKGGRDYVDMLCVDMAYMR